MSERTRLGVVGCGIMGSGIAEAAARAGCEVVVSEVDGPALAAGRARIERSLERALERGRIGPEARDAALSRLRFSTGLGALADRELVIEAVAEDLAVKSEVLSGLDRLLPPGAVLASNTSSIPIADLASATTRPGSVVGMHFFNPVPALELVEIVPSVLTDEETVRAAEHFAAAVLGKTVVRARDRAGFVVNALLVPYLCSAIRMVEEGLATQEDVDRAMELGCAHPMGPLRLADLIGLDTLLAIAESLHAEHAEPHLAPPPLLRRMVSAGLLGRKSGRGFYRYEPDGPGGGGGSAGATGSRGGR